MLLGKYLIDVVDIRLKPQLKIFFQAVINNKAISI